MIQRRKDTVRHVWVQCHLYEAYIPFSSHFDQFIIIHPVLHTCGKTMKKHTLLLISAQNLVSWFSALTIGASRENEPLWVQEVLYGIKKEGKVWRFSSSTFIMNGCQRRQKKVQNQHQAISVFRGGGCNKKRSIKWRHFMHRHSNMSHCVLFSFFMLVRYNEADLLKVWSMHWSQYANKSILVAYAQINWLPRIIIITFLNTFPWCKFHPGKPSREFFPVCKFHLGTVQEPSRNHPGTVPGLFLDGFPGHELVQEMLKRTDPLNTIGKVFI